MQHLKAASHPGETGDLSNVPSFKEGIKPTIQQLKEHATNGIVRFLIEWAGLL